MRFILRQHLGAIFVHANLGGNGRGGVFAVTSEHHDSLQAQTAQRFDNGSSFREQGVRNTGNGGPFPFIARYRWENFSGSSSKRACLPAGTAQFSSSNTKCALPAITFLLSFFREWLSLFETGVGEQNLGNPVKGVPLRFGPIEVIQCARLGHTFAPFPGDGCPVWGAKKGHRSKTVSLFVHFS